MVQMTSLDSRKRTCSRCLQRLPLHQFRRRFTEQEARHSWCRECVNSVAREQRQISKRKRLRSMCSEIRRAENSTEKIQKIVEGVAQQLGGMSRLVAEWGDYFRSDITPTQRLRMIETLMQMMVAVDLSRIHAEQRSQESPEDSLTPTELKKLPNDELLQIMTEPIRELKESGLLRESLQWLLDNGELSRDDLPCP